ncbi:MAG TPA: diguanylate cyclase [Gemmatimonadales bacterium]|nr:diguanylate cyclase [Gemmatimonadales bacterium]
MTEVLERAFQELRREYVGEWPVRLTELRDAVAALRQNAPGGATALLTLFHRLAGSGGSYGFPEISAVSRAAEQTVRRETAPDAAAPLTPAQAAALATQAEADIERLVAAFGRAAEAIGEPALSVRRPEFGWRALVHMPIGTAREWALDALRGAGYAVATDVGHAAATGASGAGGAGSPDLVVIGADEGEDPYALAAAWAAGRTAHPRAVVLVTPSGEADRLRAAAVGIDAVFSADQLATELPVYARAVARLGTPPGHVLVVTADPARAERLIGWLEQAKLHATPCVDDADVLDAVQRQLPDLILLDAHLPAPGGFTLARRLRQDPRLALVPLVFLTTEAGVAEHIEALRAGADDFLALPVDQALFLQIAVSRVERGRWVRQLVHRDGLTRLLNHATLMAELDHAVEYGRRAGSSFALLLLDLDDFGAVNDRWGWLAGDQVLAQAGALLRTTVRASDLVGRYGGEQFAVVLRDVGREGAETVAAKLRHALATAAFETDTGARVPLTARTGIAAFPADGATAAELARGAEKALRRDGPK